MASAPTQATHWEHVEKEGGFSSRYYEFDLASAVNTDGSVAGRISVEFCSTCGLHIRTGCDHTSATWINDSLLKCDTCGADCT